MPSWLDSPGIQLLHLIFIRPKRNLRELGTSSDLLYPHAAPVGACRLPVIACAAMRIAAGEGLSTAKGGGS